MKKDTEPRVTQPKLSKTLSAVDNTVLEMISSGAPLSDVLHVLSRIIEEQSPGLLCSILLLDLNGKTLRHGAAPSLPDSYTRAVDGMEIGPCAGSCGTAAYRAEPVFVSDISSDPLWVDYRDLGLHHGLRACWSTPIVSSDGKVLGTFAMYYREVRSPRPRDLQVIERATHLAAIAIGHKRAEEALRQVENRYRSIIENAVEGFFQTTPEGGYLSVNPALGRMYGYDSPEQLMTSVSDIGHQVYADPNRRAEFKRLMEEHGVVRDFEYEVYHKDGRKIWLSENARAVRDASGAVLYYEGTVEDITERKRAEEALRESEERYRMLFDDNPQPMWVFDLETLKFLAVNDAAVKHYGYSRDDFLAMTIQEIRPPEDRAALLERLSKQDPAVQAAGIWRHQKKDGALIEVEIATHELRFGPRHARLVLVNDVTERRQLENQLRQAQKMEAVGRLAGGVAHDFNNLLMVIKGHAELLVEQMRSDGVAHRKVEQIKKAADRAAGLTRQLLAFSRMQVLQPKVLDLNSVVVEIGNMLPRLIGEDIELVIVPGKSLGCVKADQSQIEQVILNLSVNARDAMPQGGQLTIETANVDLDEGYAFRHASFQAGPYVMLAVRDTGMGMDAQTQAHIFEPFFTTKELGRGTGLGLATVYGIVKQSGGWIWVYSELGQGTTFKMYLPRVGEAVEAAEQGEVRAKSPRGTETILVVEDQEGIREMAREFLEGCGYTVLEAKDGDEALQIAERHQGTIDLVVTDVVMPRVGGRELAHRLTVVRPQVKALFMSGYAEYSRAQQGNPDWDIVCLEKPFSLDTLGRKIREVLDTETAHKLNRTEEFIT
jgi:two-component system cell cycle sensor histidine kinase/response regulator CckA